MVQLILPDNYLKVKVWKISQSGNGMNAHVVGKGNAKKGGKACKTCHRK